MNFDYDASVDYGAKIKVIGVGGGGGNAINRMVEADVKGVDLYAVNTDKQALLGCKAPGKFLIGEKLTKGRGAGAKPEVGENAAEENLDDLKKILEGTDMVFVVAGMGGGTGTGAAPVIAKLAKDMGILTVGVVTKPFAFEREKRMEQAEKGIAALKQNVDSIIVIPNERLKHIAEGRITMESAFRAADDVLCRGVLSITELITTQSYMNLDFSDVQTVMTDSGVAHMGIGTAQGKDKAEIAVKAAITSPLMETSITGSRGIIVSITAGHDIGLDEVEYVGVLVSQEAGPNAEVITGMSFDDSMEDELRVTVIATGFNGDNEPDVNKVVPTAAPEAPKADAAAPKADKPETSGDGIDDTLVFFRNKNNTGRFPR